MVSPNRPFWQSRRLVGAVGVIVVLGLLLLAAVGLRGRGIRALVTSKLRAAVNLGKAVLDSRNVAGNGDLTNVVFLHHSTGRNLIEQGQVREKFAAVGLDFWDHGYNDQGLTRPDGSRTGYAYNIPNDNTNPDGLAEIFGQPARKLPSNTLSGLLQHDVIIFKSCFPISRIASYEQLETYKSFYLDIRDTMDQHPDKLFIIVTQPPSNPASTNAQEATRARALAEWLGSGEFLAGHPNIYTFDFFDLLAEPDPSSPDYNMLRQEYRKGTDSHPNARANETIAPLFVDFVVSAIEDFRNSR
jgi:hypothetical protein